MSSAKRCSKPLPSTSFAEFCASSSEFEAVCGCPSLIAPHFGSSGVPGFRLQPSRYSLTNSLPLMSLPASVPKRSLIGAVMSTLVALMSAGLVDAQVRIRGATPSTPKPTYGWSELLSRTPASHRGRPFTPAETGGGITEHVFCAYSMELPDSLGLVGGTETSHALMRWHNWGMGEVRPMDVPYPDKPDTLKVAVVGAWCYDWKKTFQSPMAVLPVVILVRHADVYLGVNGHSLLTRSNLSADRSTPVVVLGKDGRWAPALWALSCVGETCTGRIVDARIVSDSVRRARARAARASAAAMRNRGWSAEDIALIQAGKVRIGMTAAQVRAAWGAPDRIRTTVTADGRSEHWVYGTAYVHIVGDRVLVIQK